MIVVSNRIQVAAGHEKEFEERFAGRAELVDKMSGFVRLEILRPIKSDYYVVLTHWEDQESFRAWTESPEVSGGAQEPPALGDFLRPERFRDA